MFILPLRGILGLEPQPAEEDYDRFHKVLKDFDLIAVLPTRSSHRTGDLGPLTHDVEVEGKLIGINAR